MYGSEVYGKQEIEVILVHLEYLLLKTLSSIHVYQT